MFVLTGSSACLLKAVQESLCLVYVHSCAGVGHLIQSADSCPGTLPQSAGSGRGSAVVCTDPTQSHPNVLGLCPASPLPVSFEQHRALLLEPCCAAYLGGGFVFFQCNWKWGRLFFQDHFLALVLGYFFSYLTSYALLQLSLHKAKCN